jgi:hypothetical protein
MNIIARGYETTLNLKKVEVLDRHMNRCFCKVTDESNLLRYDIFNIASDGNSTEVIVSRSDGAAAKPLFEVEETWNKLVADAQRLQEAQESRTRIMLAANAKASTRLAKVTDAVTLRHLLQSQLKDMITADKPAEKLITDRKIQEVITEIMTCDNLIQILK